MNTRQAMIHFLVYLPVALALALLPAAGLAWLLADDKPGSAELPRAATEQKGDGAAKRTDPATATADDGKKSTSLTISPAKDAATTESAAAAQALAQIKNSPTSVTDLLALQKAIQQAQQKALPATVGIRIRDTFGSGIVVTEDGYVLTAGHVVAVPDRDATIIFPDGKRVHAKTKGVNRDIDSGLLKITDEGKYPHVEIGHSSELKLGQWCISLGHPNGLTTGRPPVLRAGRVLYSRDDAIQTDDTIVAGDSGGPLLDLAGRVVGIHSRISDGIIDNYHVPIDTYRDTWDRLVKGESWGPPSPGGPLLGINGQTTQHGCKVTDIFSRTPAAKAGLKIGDVITSFGGDAVLGLDDLQSLLNKHKPGEEVTLAITRGEEKLELKVTLAKRAED